MSAARQDSSAALTLSTGPQLSIDASAIAANTRLLADRAGGELMAVVKADGFGHGAELVARTALAHGATWLGVTSLEEAFPLRRAGLRAPILSWLNPVAADWAAGIAADVDLAVPGLAHLDAITRAVATAGPGSPMARVHLHLDTGMARDGAAPEDWVALCQAARNAEHAGLIRVVGMMGHLGCAATPLHPANATDRTRFAWGLEVARAAGLRPQHRHLAATAATLTDPSSHHTLVRIGAGLVGIDPSGTSPLRGALTLTAPVVSVRRVDAGTPVGYDHSWTAPHSTVLALLPVGYADGLPRAASGQAEVLIRGERRPVVGRISMDQAVVDLGAGSTLQPGESATVFGPGDQGEPTVADWAEWSGTLAHEIVTGIGPRVQRAVIPTALDQPTPPAGSVLVGSRA